MTATTRDALLGGRVVYEQPARGYRVALEAPMLARFAVGDRRRSFGVAIDLGAGPGATTLCLAVTGWAVCSVAVEIDEEHAAIARRNVLANELAGLVTVITNDVAHVRAPRGDLVIANPPWL